MGKPKQTGTLTVGNFLQLNIGHKPVDPSWDLWEICGVIDNEYVIRRNGKCYRDKNVASVHRCVASRKYRILDRTYALSLLGKEDDADHRTELISEQCVDSEIASLRSENLRLHAEVKFIDQCKNDKAKAEHTSHQRMKYIQELTTKLEIKEADLQAANMLVAELQQQLAIKSCTEFEIRG